MYRASPGNCDTSYGGSLGFRRGRFSAGGIAKTRVRWSGQIGLTGPAGGTRFEEQRPGTVGPGEPRHGGQQVPGVGGISLRGSSIRPADLGRAPVLAAAARGAGRACWPSGAAGDGIGRRRAALVHRIGGLQDRSDHDLRQHRRVLPCPPGSDPSGIASSGASLWFTQFGAGKVARFNLFGSVAQEFTTEGSGPSGIVFGRRWQPLVHRGEHARPGSAV